MSNTFAGCMNMSSAPNLDTSNVTNAYEMFNGCTSLTAVPQYDTTNMSSVSRMFRNCYNVESGALDLYQQMSTQANPPVDHGAAFSACGRDTVNGAAELAQIPSDWK